MTDRYADAGIYYLPIERIDEFPCLKDGREVLVRWTPEDHQVTIVVSWDAECQQWEDQEFNSYRTALFDSFAPMSLQPIGEHVAVECGCMHTSNNEYSISGHSSFDTREWIGDGKRIDATVTVRVPIRKPPHGDAS